MKIYTLIPAGLMLLGGAALADDAVEVRADEDEINTSVDTDESKVDVSVEEGRQAYDEGRDAIRGDQSPLAMGELRDGREVRNTVTTNATGLFLGQGLNAAFERSFSDKFSGVAGANFSRTRAAGGAVTNFGVMAGVDWFLLGGNNEGLRLGPRVDVGFGNESIGDNSSFASVGIAGELGYNWIATNGITAGVAGGIHGQTGGVTREGGNGSWNPYGALNLGYSW